MYTFSSHVLVYIHIMKNSIQLNGEQILVSFSAFASLLLYISAMSMLTLLDPFCRLLAHCSALSPKFCMSFMQVSWSHNFVHKRFCMFSSFLLPDSENILRVCQFLFKSCGISYSPQIPLLIQLFSRFSVKPL
jgi:hypothetical protein